MRNSSIIPLKAFTEVSIADKAKAIESYGRLLITAEAHGLDFFLYSLDNYFVEVASQTEGCNVIYIKATDQSGVMDLYLDKIQLPAEIL